MGAFDEVDQAIAKERGTVPASALPANDVMRERYGPAPADSAPAPPQTAYKGSLLPFSRDAQGNVSFDPLNAGPIGAFRQAFTLPGRVHSGEVKVDPSNPKFIGETLNFAGSFGSPVNPAIRSGDRVIPGVTRNAPDMASVPTPTWQQLVEKGGAQLENFSKAPVRYNPEHAVALAQRIENDLVKDGVFAHEAPGIYAALTRLRNNVPPHPGDEVIFNPASLHSLRKNIAEQFGKPTESQHGVGVAFRHVNDFIANPPKGAVLAGPATEAAREFERGLGNYAAGMRAKELESIKRTADLRASSANSGQNVDNSLRGRIASHVLDARKVKGYTPEEIAMLEAVPVGTIANNIKRGAGNVLGGGGGLGATATGAAAYGIGNLFGLGPAASAAAGVVAPVVGGLLKRSAGKSTQEALDEASTILRQRSPLFEAQPKYPGAPADPMRDRMARTLMQLEAQAGAGVPVDQPVVPEGEPLRITVTPRR
jgi:hypothetical protein